MYFVDMHCDTLSKLLEHQEAESGYGNLRKNAGHVDLERMKKADYLLQNFALFVFAGDGKDPYTQVNLLADLFDKEIAANSDMILPVKTYVDNRKQR